MRPLGLHRRLGPLSSSSSSSCYSSSSASSDWFRGLRPTRSGPFRTQVRPAKGQCSRSAGGAMSARLGSLRVHLSFSSRKSNSLDLPHSHFSPSYRDLPISTRFYWVLPRKDDMNSKFIASILSHLSNDLIFVLFE